MLSIAAGVYMYKMYRKTNKKVRTSKVIVLPLNEKQILSSGYDYSRLSTGDYVNSEKGRAESRRLIVQILWWSAHLYVGRRK